MNVETTPELITAEQAKSITISKRKSLPDIIDMIKVMANNGHDYATFNKGEVNITDELTDELKGLGFIVEISDNHYSITW